MQENDQQAQDKNVDKAHSSAFERVLCPNLGKWVPVTFEIGRMFLIPMRTDVITCPVRNKIDCNLACLSPVHGATIPGHHDVIEHSEKQPSGSQVVDLNEDAASSSVDRVIMDDPYSSINQVH
jgi:hypothetical protein